MSKYEQLEKIQQLKESGLLTNEEFIIEKSKILNDAVAPTAQRVAVQSVPLNHDRKTNGAATASLVLALVGLIIVPMLLGLLAVIFGGVGASKDAKQYRGQGAAVAGLIIGVVDIIWGIVWFRIFIGR